MRRFYCKSCSTMFAFSYGPGSVPPSCQAVRLVNGDVLLCGGDLEYLAPEEFHSQARD